MAQLTKVAGTPMGSTAEAVEAVGGVEEEWFLEGTATAYGLADGATQYPTDGRWPAGGHRRGAVPHPDGRRAPDATRSRSTARSS